MKSLPFCSLFFVIIALSPSCKKSSPATYQNISALQASKIHNDQHIFIDVRTPEEIAEGKIEGAVEIDFRGSEFRDQIAKLDRSESYVVYCRSGRRSAETSEMMANMGFEDVSNMEGGILAWQS